MTAAVKLSLLASGLFLFVGMGLGVWKYAAMMRRPTHQAPRYVDLAHRAALLYAFAALVIAQLVAYSPYPVAVQLAAAGAVFFFFALTTCIYIYHGLADRPTSQFEERTLATTAGMYLVIAGELGGFSVILWGFITAVVL